MSAEPLGKVSLLEASLFSNVSWFNPRQQPGPCSPCLRIDHILGGVWLRIVSSALGGCAESTSRLHQVTLAQPQASPRACGGTLPSWCPHWALGTSCELGTAGATKPGAWDVNLEEPWDAEHPHACLHARTLQLKLVLTLGQRSHGRSRAFTPWHKAAVCFSHWGLLVA